MSKGTIS
jgi:hypothetical protein